MLEELTIFLQTVAVIMVPYAMCSLGLMIGGWTGVLNISADGVMMIGASIGFLGAYFINTVAGVLLAILAGAFFGFFLVFVSERWKINPFIMGIILFIFLMGLSDFFYKITIGVRTVPPVVHGPSIMPIPGLSQIPVVGALFNQNILVYLTYILVVLLSFLMYKTRIGLDTRAVGEDPKTADTAGIGVFRRRCASVTIGGMIMGLAGLYLPLVIAGTYSPGGVITGGRGFMAIGLVIFGSFRPERILAGSFLFAGIETFVHRLVLTPGASWPLFMMIPFIVVLIVLAVFHKYIGYPAAMGKPYSRE
ncbi:MAG: ABC transporter permease [Aigarchaeota archaeon]|nr:ABC transporter permease [Aigarchaeota archaeon]